MGVPRHDGDVNEYVNPEAQSTRWFDASRRVVFVNGMLNSPQDHEKAALALSLLQMCRVVGIYNASRVSEGTWETARAVVEDLVQCAADKLQWDSTHVDRFSANLHTWYQSQFGDPSEAVRLIDTWLARNPPARSLFRYVRDRSGQPVTIFCHSQGNLITSNALTGLQLIDPRLLGNLTVNSYASPAVFWPEGFTHNRYAYTLDIVPLVAGFGNSLSLNTSTIGGPEGVVSHGFENYRRDDATFVVNQFRWGMLRMTASMDEDGLANALLGMGTNMPRIYNIFRRLDDAHRTDVDDVALLYVEKIRHRRDLLSAAKSHAQLRALLIRSMEEGWTSDRERAAIRLLQA